MEEIFSPKPSTSHSKVESEMFLSEIDNHFRNILKYENEALIKKAISVLPLEDLEIKAVQRMRRIQQIIKEGNSEEFEISHPEAMLVELMDWFKNSYFSWVDKPACSFCESPTKLSKNTKRSNGGEVIRVEVYICPLCETLTEFPRYNDPAKLLETRKGRCGEWANCFMLFCRALNYDSRLIVDTTDHVWVEVYSFDRKKWLHCDPCENVIDKPLLYEVGWGKKLEYVIAYSRDDLQDVTWRYTTNHKEVRARRKLCSESELIDRIMYLRSIRWRSLSEARVKFLKNRIAAELLELLIERTPTKSDNMGRSSGSLSWRLQRKETKPWIPHTFNFVGEKQVKVKYSSATDFYQIYSSNTNSQINTISQWMNGAYEIENVFRKEEHDWKMVYLAREENSDSAKISWRFTTTDEISAIEIKVSSRVYEDGCIRWELHTEHAVHNVSPNEEFKLALNDSEKIKDFKLIANLSLGKGDTAWQHTQLFRQSTTSSETPFEVTINFKKSL